MPAGNHLYIVRQGAKALISVWDGDAARRWAKCYKRRGLSNIWIEEIY